jgi:hypothetical protein
MLVAVFILLNVGLVVPWCLFFVTLRPNDIGADLVYAGLAAAAQVVLMELLLGVGAVLYLRPLILCHLACGLGLLGWIVRRDPKAPLRVVRLAIARAAARARDILGWETVLLSLLILFVAVWLVAAGALLPPRGIDDLVYHLPPIYQSVQKHRIELLPLQLRDMFAFPLDGELLFLWPLIFFHADSLIDLVQLVVALYGVLVVYAMARSFDVSPRNAAFAACLFLFTPVVLGQAGSNYVDLISGVLYLVILFAATRFHTTGDFLDLAIAGVATGFAAGSKYSMLVFVAAVQPLLWLRWGRGLTPRRYAAYLFLALPLSAYWPLRNFLRTGHPFYPLMPSSSGFRLVPESTFAQITRAAPSVLSDFLAHPAQALSYPFRDPGLGSFHGGFGVVFWGLGAPAILYCIGKALKAAFRERRLFPLTFWGQVLVAGAAFAVLPAGVLDFTPRYILFLVGFGLLALLIVFRRLGEDLPGSVPILKGFCVAASVLAVIHLATYRWPSYQIAAAADDWSQGRRTSEYEYLRQAGWDLPSLSRAWAPLDYLTRSGRGWSVYMACGWSVFWTAPSYGSRLQNRIWNFEPQPAEPPDAFLFHYDRRGRPLYYVGRRITPDEVLRDGRYALVAQTRYTTLWVDRRLLDDPAVSARLADYYALTFGPVVRAAERIAPLLDADGVVITASELGYGLRYLSLTNRLATPVYLVPANREAALAARLGARKVFTVGAALPGFQSRPVAFLAQPNGKVAIYENTRS